MSYSAFLDMCGNFAEKNSSDVDLYYKPHPLDPRVHLSAGRCDNTNIDDLIASADVVLTYNSGVGLLAYMHDKPVLTAGRAYHAGLGLSRTVSHIGELDRAWLAPNENFDPNLRRAFVGHLVQNVLSEVKFHHIRLWGSARLAMVEPSRVRIWGRTGVLLDHPVDLRATPISLLRPYKRWLSNRMALFGD